MYSLADGDFTKISKVESMSVEEAFTFMAYERDLHLQENVKI